MTAAWGQQLPQCDLLKRASIALCQKDYDFSLTTLIQFQKEFPEHALIEEVNQQVGHLYFLKVDYDTAKDELKKLSVDKIPDKTMVFIKLLNVKRVGTQLVFIV